MNKLNKLIIDEIHNYREKAETNHNFKGAREIYNALFAINTQPNECINEVKLNLNKLPATELHLHIEGGALPMQLAKLFATLNKVYYPEEIEDKTNHCWRFNNLFEFFDDYDVVASVVKTAYDLYVLTYIHLASQAVHANLIYCEVGISPIHFAKPGYKTIEEINIPIEPLLFAIEAAFTQARNDFAVETGLKIYHVRNRLAAEPEGFDHLQRNLTLARQIIPHLSNKSYPIVIGLAGNEAEASVKDYQPLYQFYKIHIPHIKLEAHMEFASKPEIIESVLTDEIPLDRIAHGLRASESESTMELIAEKGVVLTVCPLSDVFVYRLFPTEHPSFPGDQATVNIHNHPLHKLLGFRSSNNKRIKLTVNSDDPAFFGQIGEVRAAVALSLAEQAQTSPEDINIQSEMLLITKNGVDPQGSFLQGIALEKLQGIIKIYEIVLAIQAIEFETGQLFADKQEFFQISTLPELNNFMNNHAIATIYKDQLQALRHCWKTVNECQQKLTKS